MPDQNQDYQVLTANQRTSAQEIIKSYLSHEKIRDIIEKNQDLEIKINRAAEMLLDTLDPLSALLVAAKAIRKDKINVFVSYKKQDEDAARTVVKELRKYGGRHLDIEYMAEFTESTAGEEFNKKIRQCIKKAHWFILLLPDPSIDWDWCLFETGMFRGRMLEKVHKLFCLHHPNQVDLPPQINEFQAVSAEPDQIKGFLRNLFKNKDSIPGMDPISPYIEENLDETTATIINAIKPRCQRLDRKFLDHYVLLSTRNLKSPDMYQTKEAMYKEMYDMEIVDTDHNTLMMFGMIDKPRTWGEMVSGVESDDALKMRWLTEIFASIRKVLKKRSYGPIQATLKGTNSGKLWRPCLTAVDRTGGGQIESILILFVEEISVGLTTHIPPDALALITVLRLTYRFRWEILKRYTNSITEEEIGELKDSLDRIETEARSRGLIDQEKILQLFASDPTAATQIKRMFDTWSRVRNDQRTGELDLAIKERDPEKIKTILKSISTINQEFLELVFKRMEPMLLEM
jgi:hypothetical protein